MKVYSERKRNGENKMAPDATRTKQPLKGLIFNIQKFSLNDGPGIRTVVFFKGCPLRCNGVLIQNHNSESLSLCLTQVKIK